MTGSTAQLDRRPTWLLISLLAVTTVIIDQVSKSWAVDALKYDVPRTFIGPIRFNLAYNTGMAFSRGASSGPLIGVIALAIVVVMLFLARRTVSRIQLAAIGIIIGGALGNVIDRLFRSGGPLGGDGFMSGAVVDFIDLQVWPIFNVADMAVVAGGLALAASMIWVDDPCDSQGSDIAGQSDDPVDGEPVETTPGDDL